MKGGTLVFALSRPEGILHTSLGPKRTRLNWTGTNFDPVFNPSGRLQSPFIPATGLWSRIGVPITNRVCFRNRLGWVFRERMAATWRNISECGFAWRSLLAWQGWLSDSSIWSSGSGADNRQIPEVTPEAWTKARRTDVSSKAS